MIWGKKKSQDPVEPTRDSVSQAAKIAIRRFEVALEDLEGALQHAPCANGVRKPKRPTNG